MSYVWPYWALRCKPWRWMLRVVEWVEYTGLNEGQSSSWLPRLAAGYLGYVDKESDSWNGVYAAHVHVCCTGSSTKLPLTQTYRPIPVLWIFSRWREICREPRARRHCPVPEWCGSSAASETASERSLSSLTKRTRYFHRCETFVSHRMFFVTCWRFSCVLQISIFLCSLRKHYHRLHQFRWFPGDPGCCPFPFHFLPPLVAEESAYRWEAWFFTSQMSFPSPKQQCWSMEGSTVCRFVMTIAKSDGKNCQPHSSLSVSDLHLRVPTTSSHFVLSLSLPPQDLPLLQVFPHRRLPSSFRTDPTDFITGQFLRSISVFVLVSPLLFLFGSMRQIKLTVRQLLGACKYIPSSYRVISKETHR